MFCKRFARELKPMPVVTCLPHIETEISGDTELFLITHEEELQETVTSFLVVTREHDKVRRMCVNHRLGSSFYSETDALNNTTGA